MFKKCLHFLKPKNRGGSPVGLALIVLGGCIIGLCIPLWVWAALVGAVLLVVGYWLYRVLH